MEEWNIGILESWVKEASLPSGGFRSYFVFVCIPNVPTFHHSIIPELIFYRGWAPVFLTVPISVEGLLPI